ncbi:hypothetical protein AAGG74_15700 [Bacillus mexicanus]|uniref:hypothetical protein n=1 Tax=Bacillus mexicanus TaxID=2834415 RepID=UPI003D2413AA
MKKEPKYQPIITESFLEDIELIKQEKLVDPNDWGLFTEQINKEMKNLDRNWKSESRKTNFPPLSTYGYRKRYLQSIPPHIKEKRGWESVKADFRIIFNVYEERKEILYFAIGKRIKVLPKHPLDIYSLIKGRTLTEENIKV